MADNKKMGLNATWSMAVGGMIGGGIFSVLGVIISIAGSMAWVSFLIAGLIALATAISYSNLTNKFKEGGGTFSFIKEINHQGLAGGLSCLLLCGYILTLSVYAFTFGHYLEQIFSLGPWFPRFSSVSIILIFVYFNIKGVGEASWIEIITVWGKLVILLGIAFVGLSKYSPGLFVSKSNENPGVYISAIIGAATIFMAYEGFQLITYDYNSIDKLLVTIKKAEILAVLTVIIVYILVTSGTLALLDYNTIIEKKEVVLAIAGKKLFGTVGLIIASIGALFSTGSAINSTIFATSRLATKVANDGELPELLADKNNNGIPGKSIILIGGLGAVLASIGALSALVEAASFIFLITFTIVNFVAFYELDSNKLVSISGAIGAMLSLLVLSYRFIHKSPTVLVFLSLLIVFVTIGRTLLYKYNHI